MRFTDLGIDMLQSSIVFFIEVYDSFRCVIDRFMYHTLWLLVFNLLQS
jgi:hypothetical protein